MFDQKEYARKRWIEIKNDPEKLAKVKAQRNAAKRKNQEANRIANKELYYKTKQEAINKLGGACVDCGSTENLEFDHIYPGDKDLAASSPRHKTRFMKEIEKCELRCKACHKLRSGKQRKIAWQLLCELDADTYNSLMESCV